MSDAPATRGSEVLDLTKLLTVERVDDDVFVGASVPGPRERLFGGHVAAQAIMAAGHTIATSDEPGPQLRAHSLHAYFLRAGSGDAPIEYTVERLRDGKSFATRSVRARQLGRVIFALSCSFHRHEDGPAHQIAMPDVPPPERCIDLESYLNERRKRAGKAEVRFTDLTRPIELRPIDPPDPGMPQPPTTMQRLWVRACGVLPDDARLHVGVATWASDYTLLGAMRRPHGGGPGYGRRDLMTASLDHAVWFHKAFRMDEWLLYDQTSPVTFGSRGLSQGHYFTQSGELVASMCQEGLLRPIDPTRTG